MTRKDLYLTSAGAAVGIIVALGGSAPDYATSDGALVIAAVAGVIVFGLWGDTIVGVAILGVASAFGGVAFGVRRLGRLAVGRHATDGTAAADSPGASRVERPRLIHR